MTLETIVEEDLEVQEKHDRMNKKTSIKEALKAVSLPVISFYNNGKILNFVVDSGSSNSLIDKNSLNECEYEKLDDTLQVYGMDGIKTHCEKCIMVLTNEDNKEFKETFTIQDMSAAFGYLKSEGNAAIHGLLGASFFTKYRYIIDFKNLQVYQTRTKQVVVINTEAKKVTVTDLPKDNMTQEEIEKFIMRYLKLKSLDNVAYIAGFLDNYKL